jgi:hypothetical protein
MWTSLVFRGGRDLEVVHLGASQGRDATVALLRAEQVLPATAIDDGASRRLVELGLGW